MLYLKNALVLDHQSLVLHRTSVKVNEGPDGRIEFISDSEIPREAGVMDCSGMLVTKAFACGHHHAYSGLAYAMPPPARKPANFVEILELVWWKLDKFLDRDMIEASALLTAMKCAKNGVTFCIDHHSSPNFIDGSLELIAKAFEKVGISHLLCYEISDRDGMDKAEQGLAETDQYLQKNQGLVGLHAGFTVGRETMRKAVELAHKHGSGIHIHTAEDKADEEISMEHYGRRVAKRFQEEGVLDFPSTLLAHCLHLDAEERELVKNSRAWVAQNTESNLNNKVGAFSSAGLGERIMLGTDGMHSDMIKAAQACFEQNQQADPMSASEMYGRFRKVHDYIASNKFSGDGPNNLVVMDLSEDLTTDNIIDYFIHQMNASRIRHVISDGRLIVSDGKLVSTDESEILRFAEEQTAKFKYY